MITSKNNSEHKPLIIQYQTSTDKIGRANVQGQTVIAHSISVLIDLLKLHQTHENLSTSILVVICPSDFRNAKVDLEEFVTMVHSFHRCTLSSKSIYFAVVAHKPISRAEFRSFKNLGISGLIPDVDGKETVEAIQTLSKGIEYWPFSLIDQPIKKVKDSDQIKLTPRQEEILSLVCNRGISNKKIAQMLNISESTVKVHISAILKAYRVRNRTQLALFAQHT
jgi:DNA-binding CsgD family transcriptional regulator